MSSSLDKMLMAMSLEEKDDPFDLPDSPEFCSKATNSMSLIGRILNPDCQQVSSLVLDMPRKWQIYDRVRGVALSQERFQFIFRYEHDLEDILNKGVHTYNQWVIAMDRWIENPPEDYLQFISIWVQLRNIPVNHYTPTAIKTLAGFAGKVIDLDFDQTKAQNKDYVRVCIRFDVSKPLRRSKVVNLPSGEATTILYDYERIQKRCFSCQRLTHERDNCPLFIQKQQELKEKLPQLTDSSTLSVSSSLTLPNPAGRIRIDPLVIAELRQFFVGSTELNRFNNEGKSTNTQAAMDHITSPNSGFASQAISPLPPGSEKGKEIAMESDKTALFHTSQTGNICPPLPDLMLSDIPFPSATSCLGFKDSFPATVNNSEAGPSKSHIKRAYVRKKPFKPRKNLKGTPFHSENLELDRGLEIGVSLKRKGIEKPESSVKVARLSNSEMVPKVGLSDH